MSPSPTTRTALVTGANAGLGFEAAAQLAEDGWDQVILMTRTVKKGEEARQRLVERTGRDPYSVVVIDTSEVASAEEAVAELARRGHRVDFFLLNAGASSAETRFNADGVEQTYASTLVGHHVLTIRSIEQGVAAPTASIVIAGSEGARNSIPGFKTHDIDEVAQSSYGGDRIAAIRALMRIKAPQQSKFVNMNEYVTAKLLVAWWAAALSRRLPKGMTVFAVSPGANAATSFARDAPAAMRFVMLPVMKAFGRLMGMNGPVGKGARRYLDAAEFGLETSGSFYATAHPRKLVGPMDIQTKPAFFTDVTAQEDGFAAIEAVTGVSYDAQRVS